MTRIAIASIFRNSTGYLDRYIRQLSDLTGHLAGLGYDIHLIAAEGDSTDSTWRDLNERLKYLFGYIVNVAQGSELTIIKAEHGGPVFGSIDDSTRWRNISFVCNKVLESVADEDDSVLYVESDLIWDAQTMLYLMGHVGIVDAVAPLSIHQPTGLFYDTWGHRKGGVPFQQQRPYHPDITSMIKLVPIDSAGSCIAMKGEVARVCRFTPPELGIVGFGNDIRAHGYTLMLDPSLRVMHP